MTPLLLAMNLVMLMGKGGVGKTTLAAAIAVELASRGLAVHLTTSDPATQRFCNVCRSPLLHTTARDPTLRLHAHVA